MTTIRSRRPPAAHPLDTGAGDELEQPHVDLDLQVRGGGEAATAVVRLRGALDASSSDQLQRMGERLVAAGLRNLVLDCSALVFCDLHGLRAALVLTELVRPDGHVTLEGPPPLLRRLVRATGSERALVLSPARRPEPPPAPTRPARWAPAG